MFGPGLAQVLVVDKLSKRNSVTLRFLSDTRPHESATLAVPTLEDVYLPAVGARPVAA